MLGGIAPTHAAIGSVGPGLPLSMWLHVASVRCAFTDRLATAMELASDPLGRCLLQRRSPCWGRTSGERVAMCPRESVPVPFNRTQDMLVEQLQCTGSPALRWR